MDNAKNSRRDFLKKAGIFAGTLAAVSLLKTDIANAALTLKAKGSGSTQIKVTDDGRVGIGTENPKNSAILDISSTNKGILFPGMTKTQRDSIASPENGLQVFNSTGNVPSAYSSLNQEWYDYPFKKTYSVEKLGSELAYPGAAGDRQFLKIYYPFYADQKFVRVYEDGIELQYGVEWLFNTTDGKKIGRVTDLTDGVRIPSAHAGSTYRLEVDEWILPYTPFLLLYRTDNYKITRSMIPFRAFIDGTPQTLTGITHLDWYASRADYSSGGFVYHYYGNRLAVAGFRKGSAEPLPDNWRIEVYKIGKKTQLTSKPNWTSTRSAMDSGITPIMVSTNNEIDLENYTFARNEFTVTSGIYLVRMRETEKNIVTNFSVQKLKLKNFGVRNWDTGAQIDKYYKSGLI